jgi:hypothetical protein
MVYNRASVSDYDAWETVYGNKGWGSDKLIPLLKKVNSVFIPFEMPRIPLSGRDVPRGSRERHAWNFRAD